MEHWEKVFAQRKAKAIQLISRLSDLGVKWPEVLTRVLLRTVSIWLLLCIRKDVCLLSFACLFLKKSGYSPGYPWSLKPPA